MSTEELIQPRYKVIADYPHSPYTIGEMVEIFLKVPYPSFFCTRTTCEDIDGRTVYCSNWVQLTEINKYPHLFKKLEWYEDRDPIGFPEYVKWVNGGVFEVVNWRSNHNTGQLDGVYTADGFLFINDLLPATEVEYNEYCSKLKL